jgi:hypothetical protein
MSAGVDQSRSDRRPTDQLNLSRRPFVNNRPVTRAAILLWLIGFVLLAVDVFVFWSYLENSREKRAAVRSGQEEIAAARQALARREEQVARLDLGRQNEEVGYLNGKIAQRTFSWSRLFDRLAEVLPSDVRLQRLSPRGLADEKTERQAVRRPTVRRTTDLVTLQIGGQAKSDEALLEFVDDLFAHPSFADPNLAHEAREKDGLIRFELAVDYLPNAPVAGPVRPPAHLWKLAPEPGAVPTFRPAPQLQARAPAQPPSVPPAAPAPRAPGFAPAVPRPTVPTAPTLRAFPPSPAAPRVVPRTIVPPSGLRGIGTPRSHGAPVPDEGTRPPNEQGSRR